MGMVCQWARQLALTALVGAGLGACRDGSSSDNDVTVNPTGGGNGTPTFPEGATFIAAGEDLTRRIQEALINASSGETIVLPKGHFEIESTLAFDGDTDGDQVLARDITIMGYGMDETILDFEDSVSGDGIYVQNARNITIQDLSVREAANNGIKLKDTNGIILRRVSTIWEGELGPDNGAYGLYPVECQNVLIEDSYVRGSADAGVYVGQSEYIVVRRTVAEENVAGIEIENSKYADVYDNQAIGNTGGILVFDLPIGNQNYGTSVRVFNNLIESNNTENFANTSSFAAGVHIVPPGTGLIILSTSDVEVFNNTIHDHDTMAVAISSFFVAETDISAFVSNYGQPGQAIADGWRPIPRNIFVHNNTITESSSDPNGNLIQDIITLYNDRHGVFPAILYDGVGEGLANDGVTELLGLVEKPFAEDGSDNVCLKDNGDVSVGQFFASRDVNIDDPAVLYEAAQDTLMTCEQLSLPVHTVTFGEQIFGCGVDDETAGCDGGNRVGSSGEVDGGESGFEGDGDQSLCQTEGAEVNWAALLGANCPKLSDYNLFADAAEPTSGANSGGLIYDLNTPLFTDYASKYRFVFVPDGQSATYHATEAFEFPVGSVMVKTFALPVNTAQRGIANEELIETRLLIRREGGWSALPYVWNAEKSDAVLSKAGAVLDKTVVHNSQTMNFDYVVPKVTDCKQCHQFLEDGDTSSRFVPIGPKARNLNKTFAYEFGTANQLTAWQNLGLLSGVPADLGSVPLVPAYNDGDETALASRTDAEIMALAKGYLDVNCAHCHRPEGNASNTGLKLEFWRPYNDGDQGSAHGTCRKPVAFGGGSLSFDVIPGNPDESILHFRMDTDVPGDRMPEIGRDLVHAEGVALIREWINRLPAASCSQSE